MRTSHALLSLGALVLVAHAALAQAPAPRAPAPRAAPSASSSAAAPSASASAAPAPTTPTLSDTLTGQAKNDYESAKMLFGVNDFEGALIKFQSAYDQSKDARLLYNMATCESKLHHYAKALGLMRQYVKDGGALLTDQDKADAQAAIQAMEPLTANVTLQVNEAGADVYVDDQLVGKSPLEPFVLDLGVHKVRVHKDEFQDYAKDLTVNGAGALTATVTLSPIVHEGHLTVSAPSNAAIALDGTAIAIGSWSGSMKSGGHTLRVTAQGMLPYQTEVLLEDGQSRTIDVTLNPEPRKGLPAWVWITGGAVLAGGAAVGGYFLFKPTSKYEGPTGNLAPGVVQANAPIKF
jgi:PEGA domain-containing protein